MVRAGARMILGLLVLTGPAICFWLERLRVWSNAEQAVRGLAWGVALSVFAAIGLALLARGSGMDRFRWFAVSVTVAIVVWLGLLGLATLAD